MAAPCFGVHFVRNRYVVSSYGRPFLHKIYKHILYKNDASLRLTHTRKLTTATNNKNLLDIYCVASTKKTSLSCGHSNVSNLLKSCRLSERRQIVTSTDKNCWRCGRQLDLEEELFFCECGVVQEVSDDLTYFELFQFETKFDIDTEKLSKMYKALQTRLHPDKFNQKTEEEKRFSVGQSALINKAYRTLSKPLSRGLYLLELKGHPVEETNMYISKPEFLMQIMEMNDVLSEAESTDDIEAVTLENSAQLRECLLLLSDAFQEDDIDFAKEILIKLTYYTNVDDKIKEMHRKEMDN